ncbi:hypothetical protein [Chryseolinea lacunae]|uniref:Uncharacterized protein n=1 Tax=Chryseolinea lacunae TaxID=2801331 RepID=A0ABS1L2U0_9BACT|nr:hypothetical protein [Chryseolinea lacunae]MBL0745954.1 hypothetical protein [Chryseolinea lacunae]
MAASLITGVAVFVVLFAPFDKLFAPSGKYVEANCMEPGVSGQQFETLCVRDVPSACVLAANGLEFVKTYLAKIISHLNVPPLVCCLLF